MLSKLFGSNTRVKLLKLFLLNPGQKHYIREIARNLKLQVNSVRRELVNLEKLGLLSSFSGEGEQDGKSHDKKYYKVNQTFVLFEELKGLITKSQILQSNAFVENLQKISSPKLLILTGIFANNSNCPTDILLVGRVNKKKFGQEIAVLEKSLDREVNYTIMDMQEYIYRRDITDIFLYNILEGKKIVIINEIDKE